MTNQLSNEIIQKITEFANKVAWKRPDLNVLQPEFAGQYSTVATAIEQHLKLSDFRKKLVLPDLRAFKNESVAVFTDYGGESKGSNYLTYSTLVCGWNLTHQFLEAMKLVRTQSGLGVKEIEFKDFGMGQIQRALPGYLQALNNVPGFLFTLAVDKKLASLFGLQGRETQEIVAQALKEIGIADLKATVTEKLLRVIHIAAYLTGLLAHDGQKIFWMTDHDAIAATEEKHRQAMMLFQRVLGIYARKGYTFPLFGGARPFEERSVEMLDLLSATDITAGAIDRYLTQRDTVPIDDIVVKQGCDLVLQWLAYDGIGLKKMNVIMRPGKNGAIEAATLEFALQNPPKDHTFIPIAV